MAGVTGIGSGIDIDSIVKSMVAAERAPRDAQLSKLEKKTTTQITALGALKSAISDFQKALGALNKPELFQARSATSSKADSVAVSASTEASAGSYSVEVKALASSSKVALRAFANPADAPASFGSGTLSLKVGDKALPVVQINASNNTLSGIRDAINVAGVDAGVSAAIVTDDAGSRLVLSSTETGEGADITVAAEPDSVTAGTFALAQLTYQTPGVEPSASDFESAEDPAYIDALKEYRKGPMALSIAQSAQITIDGMQVTSKANKIESAIEGVTLDLKAKTPESEPLTIKVAQDKAGAKKQIQAFVDGYNKLIGVINSQTKVTGVGDDKAPVTGALVGDASARGLMSSIRNELVNPQSSGSLRALTDIGITTQTDGTLAIDSAKLDKAMAGHFSELSGLFTGESGLASRMDSKLKPYSETGGVLEQRNKAMTKTLSNIDSQKEDITRRVAVLQERLYKQFNAMDLLVGQLSNTSNSLLASLENLPWAASNRKK